MLMCKNRFVPPATPGRCQHAWTINSSWHLGSFLTTCTFAGTFSSGQNLSVISSFNGSWVQDSDLARLTEILFPLSDHNSLATSLSYASAGWLCVSSQPPKREWRQPLNYKNRERNVGNHTKVTGKNPVVRARALSPRNRDTKCAATPGKGNVVCTPDTCSKSDTALVWYLITFLQFCHGFVVLCSWTLNKP